MTQADSHHSDYNVLVAVRDVSDLPATPTGMDRRCRGRPKGKGHRRGRYGLTEIPPHKKQRPGIQSRKPVIFQKEMHVQQLYFSSH